MKIFAINAGSSSLKFQLFDMSSEKVLTKGIVERIGLPDSVFSMEVNGEKKKLVKDIVNHTVAVDLVLEKVLDNGIIKTLDEIDGVGHRVVHGGEDFKESIIIDEDVIKKIDALSEFSPLHNPANLVGIKAFRNKLPNTLAVAVFDTAFHQSMDEKAFLYGIPYEYYRDYGIRKYGFHGTSHQFVSERCAEILQVPLEKLKLITCHLGNGASITAICDGKSIDTSMGFTPLDGLTMGTRSGSIDPAILPHLMNNLDKTCAEVVDILNKKSGLLGLTGFSSDLRDIESKAELGDESANLALDIFADRIKKYIGMYAAVMNGIDAIIFTAGIGENSDVVRKKVMDNFEYLGVYFDNAKNDGCREERIISTDDSPVKVIIVPTNEEIMIARDVVRLTSK